MEWMKRYIKKRVEYCNIIYTVTDTISYGGERLLELNSMNPFVNANNVKIVEGK